MRIGGNPRSTGELELIRQIRQRAMNGPDVVVGIGDDCALLRARRGEDIAVTTDLSIDGRHFRVGFHPPEAVGHRTLARGLSDLAAMGARPLAAFVSLGLPAALARKTRGKPSWMSRFYDGLLELAAEFETPLAGGDLAQSPVALADIVLVGAVPRGRALLRSGAKAGNAIYVTGALGGAAAGLAMMAEKGRRLPARLPDSLQSHFYPRPRLAQGRALMRSRVPTSAIDISDGLSTDLGHLCDESGVAAVLDAAAIPVAAGATLEQALHGGEDYELLFTAAEGARVPRSIAALPVTRIGRMVRPRAQRAQITLRTAEGERPLVPRGWEHFT